MSPTMTQVHVIGAGSVGLLVAWHLRHAGFPVTLLASNPRSAQHMKAEAGSTVTLEYAGMNGVGSGCLPIWQQKEDQHDFVSALRGGNHLSYLVTIDHSSSCQGGLKGSVYIERDHAEQSADT